MSGSVLSKALVVAGATVMSVGLLGGTAGAAEPAQQACIGQTWSGMATGSPTGFVGDAMIFIAQVGGPFNTQPGAGDAMQRFQAGIIPDDLLPNTCNDD